MRKSLPFFVMMLALCAPRSVLADPSSSSADAIRDNEARQQQIRSRVQQVGAQIDEILAEFDRNGLAGDDVATLRGIRAVLGDLSDRDMDQVIALLRAARGEGDATVSRRDVGDAYVAQQAIVARLRTLLAEFHRQQSLADL